MYKICLCVAATLLVFSSYAQNSGIVRWSVQNSQGKALENATVELLSASDSALVKAALTNGEGTAEFENIPYGKYLARASMVGYAPKYSEAFELNGASFSLASVVLESNKGQLAAVTVTASKPFIQKLADRIVVNVENSIVNAGNSAFEVLERSPGITIDPNENIALRGRQGVIIMIDGKPSPMTGADLVNFLRGLPSSAIDRIDIITNPSAKYEAAGNSGIIDIHMKKDQRLGLNGNLTAGYGQGVYPKANAGGSFNFRSKKVNLFGNYNYAYRLNLNHLLLDRNFFNNGQFAGKDLKDNYTKIPMNFNTARLGADFFVSPKTIIGAVATGNFYKVDPYNNNRSLVIDANKQPSYTFNTHTDNNNKNNNYTVNLNVKHSFDSTGHEISADLDYGSYNSDSYSRNATNYYDLNGDPLQPDYVLDGYQTGRLEFKTGKVDYTRPMKGNWLMEAGYKTSFVSADNDARFFDMSSGTAEPDLSKTNHFYYDETNNAGYLNLRKTYKKFNMQVGLRGEYTDVKTRQVMGDVRWDSSYFQLFPSAFFNYTVKKDHTLGVSVSRRIDRPGYSQLNPFLFLIDVTTYATGNPALLPQLTWNYELSYTMKNLSVTLGYSHTTQAQNIVLVRFKDVFPNIPADDNVTVQIPVNLASSDYYGLTIAAPIRINQWWNMINNANIFYNQFNGDLAGTQLNRGKVALNASTNNTFVMKKGWSAELSANVNTGGQYGFMAVRPQWALNMGVQKKILGNRGTLRFNITDIFWTNLPKATITYDNYIEYWHAYRESRVANLTFTYRFGKSSVAQARRRQTGAEEEKQRAGN